MDESGAAPGLEWRTTTVQGRRASYCTAGAGRTIVFLHGWAVTHRTYTRALQQLVRDGMRVVAPALPGFGGTAALPPEEMTLDGYAAWVASFLAAVEYTDPVVLIGHSFGGGVAIRTAHDFPKRVRALVLINSVGGSAWQRSGSIVQMIRERPLWDWGLHFSRDIFPVGQVRRVLPVILRDAITNALRNPVAFARVADIARYADLTTELEVLKDRDLPVVVLWGDGDRIVTPASIDSLVAALGTPEVIRVEGSHSWLLSDPVSFGEVMTNVLAIADIAGGPSTGKRRSRLRRALRPA